MNEADLIQRLRARYSAPEWAGVSHVPDSTGLRMTRTIDFCAVNLWPSKYRVIAVECKVRHSDFLRELDDPGKRGVFAAMVHEFWFCAPRGVIPVEELPEGCGLLETHGDGLRARRRARQDMRADPNGAFWVALIRRSADDAMQARDALGKFAEFSGRPVSYSDLIRIAKRALGRSESDRTPARVDPDDHRRSKCLHEIFLLARELVSAELGASRWGAGPPEVLVALRQMRDALSGMELAENLSVRLRSAADALDKVLGRNGCT